MQVVVSVTPAEFINALEHPLWRVSCEFGIATVIFNG
jgi:hypothetical protein